MTAHRNLPDSEIHEPKGLVSASEGAVYRSNGDGTGTWTFPAQGMGYYQDDSGVSQLIDTTATKVSIDGTGALSTSDYLPREIRGVSELWDVSTDRITPVAEGDAYMMRLDLPITSTTGNPDELTIQYDIGGAGSPTNVILSQFLALGKTAPYTLSVNVHLGVLSPIVVSNGIQLFLSTDTGTVSVTNPSILLTRMSGGEA